MKISDAELEVMQVIWDWKKVSSDDVIFSLQHKSWKDNTIKTLIKRLLDKGAIKIVDKISKSYIYEPTISEEEYQKEQLQHFIDTVCRGDKILLNWLGEMI